jgi:hypothetical protein
LVERKDKLRNVLKVLVELKKWKWIERMKYHFDVQIELGLKR